MLFFFAILAFFCGHFILVAAARAGKSTEIVGEKSRTAPLAINRTGMEEPCPAPFQPSNRWRNAHGFTQEVDQFRLRDSVGGTPTEATGMVVLPKKVANNQGFPPAGSLVLEILGRSGYCFHVA
jgi:hypothetical protein